METEQWILPPLKTPCGSCPYRRDVPSGIWDKTEYQKLPLYDLPTQNQPLHVFMCHQQNDHLCAGWVGCHDMTETLAFEDYRCLPEIKAYSERLLHRVSVISGHVSRWKLWSESNDHD